MPPSAAATPAEQTADDLLERAAAALLDARLVHRDRLLEVGRMLHEFILAYLRQREGRSKRAALALRLTREGATRQAAQRLGVEYKRISHMVKTWAAARVLGRGIDLGGTSYAHLQGFMRFVSRQKARRTRAGDVTAPETWGARPGFEASAPALLARVVAERYSLARARQACRDLARAGGLPEGNGGRWANPPGPAPSAARATASGSTGNGTGTATCRRRRCKSTVHPGTSAAWSAILASASRASPGDTAEWAWELVLASKEPGVVIARLRALMAGWKPGKPAPV